MNKDAKNKDAAWQFLKEVSYENDEMAKFTSNAGMPANKNIADSYYATMTYGELSNSMYVKLIGDSRLNIWGGALATAGDQYSNMWDFVTLANKSGKEAQDEYADLITKAFSELKFYEE